MAGKLKYDTIEEAAEASGIELNELTRPFLDTFVKRAGSNAGAKKKALYDELVELGIDGLELDKETMDSLKVRGCQFYYADGDVEATEAFAARFNLSVDEENGSIHRIKAKVKPIEERNAGKREGTVGWVTIQMLQNDDYSQMAVTEMAEAFAEYAAELGYPEIKPTTPASIQWYINYCRKTDIEICDRARTKKTSADGSTALGAELTLEKALAPRGFKKKEAAPIDEDGDDNLDLD